MSAAVRRSAKTPLLLSVLAMMAIPAASWGGLYNPCEPEERTIIPEWLTFKTIYLTYKYLGPGEVDFDNPRRKRYQLMEQIARNKGR